MNKSLLTKIGIAAILLATFVGYNAYTKWNHTHFTVNPETFNVKDSFQAVIAHDLKKYPPLEKAYQYNLLKTVNQSVILPEKHRQLTVHKIWYFYPRIYVLYSLNLHK
ncbi:MAG TPA: hypothetical protein VF149_06925, partial [Bacillales bacterium]